MLSHNIKFIHTGGPYGDETSSYKIEFPENMTVNEFICTILNDKSNEWGNFKYLTWNNIFAEYRNGKLFITNDAIYQKIKNNPLSSATSNGGWSLMDYCFEVKEK